MDENLRKILESMTEGEGMVDFEPAEFKAADQVKFAITVLLDYPHKTREAQVMMMIDEFKISRGIAYKRIAEAIEIFPSIEKVNKAFERARVSALIYRMLNLCVEKKNTRDAAQYLKLLATIHGLDNDEDGGDGGPTYIINLLKSSPESLGVKLPPNFDLNTFIQNLEGEYDRRNNTVDIEHSES